MTDAIAALRAAAGIGPYFAADPTGDGPQWIEFTDLLDDPAVLRERVTVVRRALAHRNQVGVDQIEERVAASLHSLALAARLLSPAFGAAVVASIVPALSPDRVRWQRSDGGPVPIAFLAPVGITAHDSDHRATALEDVVLTPVVAPLVRAFHDTFRVSTKVLWGNVASAVGGAVTTLGQARPDLAAAAVALAETLISRGALAGHGRYVRPWLFVRNSCCLYYRLPDGGLCGDCVLGRLS